MLEKYRRQLRSDLTEWCIEALLPFGQRPAAHHHLMIRELEAIARGENDRLMLFLPPGSAKSTYASVLFAAWFMAQAPGLSVIGASNTATLAETFSKRVQALVREHAATLGYGLRSESAELWHTSNGGQYRAAGVGGVVTGFRADCLTGDTLVQTPNGSSRLDCLEVASEACYILSYDQEQKIPIYSRLLAVSRRKARSIWRIRTAAGNVVEATGNHRFLTERGWAPAAAIVAGDVLLRSVRSAEQPQAGRCDEGRLAGRHGTVLRQEVLEYGREPQAVFGAKMHELRRIHGRDKAPVLFGRMFKGREDQDYREAETAADAAPRMRGVRKGFRAEVEGRARPVLLQGVQGFGASEGVGGAEEPRMEAWAGLGAGLAEAILPSEAGCLVQGWEPLCGLQMRVPGGRSPHQYDSDRQQAGELGNAVPFLPPEASCCGAFSAERDTVALVEQLRRDCDVFDIQIERTACFFANGILVHNCAIIDDPIRGREDADSETIREKTWNWYRADLTTRLKPNGRIVLVQTRWHESDLAGRLLAVEGARWRVVSLPAQAVSDDPLGRAVGDWLWSDDEYGYGELLRNTRADFERAGAMRDWSALYQQDPRPMEGLLFQVANFKAPTGIIEPGQTVRAWDLAATEQIGTRDPDWTVGVKMQRDGAGRFYILDVVRDRLPPEGVEELIVRTAMTDGRATAISLPQDPGQAGKSQVLYLTRKLSGYRVESSPETGDKATRAAPYASQVNVGNVWLIPGAWNRPYTEELRGFPAGTKDDQVDASSRAFNYLTAAPPPARTINFNHMAR